MDIFEESICRDDVWYGGAKINKTFKFMNPTMFPNSIKDGNGIGFAAVKVVFVMILKILLNIMILCVTIMISYDLIHIIKNPFNMVLQNRKKQVL